MKKYWFKPVIFKALSANQVTKFIFDGPDEMWLLPKMISIVGITGSCGRDNP